MPDTWYVVPEKVHNELVARAYRHRGYDADESADAARFCASASRHGIRTHNAIKGLHLDHLFGLEQKRVVAKDQLAAMCDNLLGQFPSLGGDNGVRRLITLLPSV